jgi:hypothetical protein
MAMPNEYQSQLDNILEDDNQDEITLIQHDEKWAIHDLKSACWADSIIHDKELSIAEKNKIADDSIAQLEAKIEKLKQWKVDATKKEVSDIEFFKSHLHVWHMKQIEEEERLNEQLKAQGKKEKKLSLTIKLPYRDLTCRKQQPDILVNGVDIKDAKSDPAFVDFVRENSPKFIKEEVAWGDYKKTLKMANGRYVDENGQPIEFINLVEKGNKFDWKVKED